MAITVGRFTSCLEAAVAAGNISQEMMDDLLTRLRLRAEPILKAGEERISRDIDKPFRYTKDNPKEIISPEHIERLMDDLDAEVRSKEADLKAVANRIDEIDKLEKGDPKSLAEYIPHLIEASLHGAAKSLATLKGRMMHHYHETFSTILHSVPDFLTTYGGITTKMKRRVWEFVARVMFDPAEIKNVPKVLREEVEAMARAFHGGMEHLRVAYNNAGGNIRRLTGFMPGNHNPGRIREVGEKAWVERTLPLLDWKKTVTRSGDEIRTQAARRKYLKKIHATLTKHHSVIEHNSKQLGESRMLFFKDFDSWQKYHTDFAEFGTNYYKMLTDLITARSREIALLELLGPSYEQHYHVLNRYVLKKAKDLSPNKVAKGERLGRDMFLDFTGKASVPINQRVAYLAKEARSFLASALLGKAILAAGVDINLIRVVLRDMGVKNKIIRKGMGTFIRTIGTASRGELTTLLAQLGLMTDAVRPDATALVRALGESTSGGAGSWFLDRVLRVSGLNHWTNTWRDLFKLEVMQAIYRWSQGIDEMNEAARHTFRRFGITPEEILGLKSLNAMDIPNSAGKTSGLKAFSFGEIAAHNEKLAGKLTEMLTSEVEAAVFTTSYRVRQSFITSSHPGTIIGEIWKNFTQFKNWPVGFLMTHTMRGLHRSGGTRGKAQYLIADMLIPMTLIGAMIVQTKEVLSGRNPKPLSSPEFWGRALLQGGGLGFFGDVLSGVGRSGDAWQPAMGGAIADITAAITSPYQAFRQGTFTPIGRAIADVMRYVPGSNLWFLQLFYQRAIADQLRLAIDPRADKLFRRLERASEKEGQGYWYPRGSILSGGFPKFGTMIN